MKSKSVMRSASCLVLGAMLGTSVAANAAIGDSPLTAEQYQKVIGRGIASSWFKNGFSKKSKGSDLRDFRARGFDNVRFRVNSEVFKGSEFDQIEAVIRQCIDEDLVPIISWINHKAEQNATAADKAAYIAWWKDLAQRFKGQYLVGFNLFTEVNGGSSLLKDNRFNEWMDEAVQAVRAIDPERIIILGSPNKVVQALGMIDPAIYDGDDYMMVEWHLYASGPDHDGLKKNWEGNGSPEDRARVTTPLDLGVAFTERTGIECYFGAWMPMDNISGSLTQSECENFARYFLQECSRRGIPWTANADSHYYDGKADEWLGVAKTTPRQLDMKPLVDLLVGHADFYEGVDTDPAIIFGSQANQAPAFSTASIATADATEGQAYSGSIVNSASDPEGDALTYSAVVGPDWLSVADDGSLSGTPSAADVGANSWTVQVSAQGGSDTATLNIEVLDDGVVPTKADAGSDLLVKVDGIATVTLDASASTGAIVSYTWQENGTVIASGVTAQVDLTQGTHTIDLVVTDVDGNTEIDSVVVVVEQVAEELDLVVSDVTVTADASRTALVKLNAVVQGDYVDIVWKKDGLRMGVGTTIEVVLAEGVHTVVARAKDAAGNVVRANAVVTVIEYVPPVDPNNTAPVFKKEVVLSTKAKVGKSISKDISSKARDADGDALTFAKVGDSGWLKVSANGKISGTPSASDKGNNTFTIEVSDGKGGTDTAKVKIKVK